MRNLLSHLLLLLLPIQVLQAQQGAPQSIQQLSDSLMVLTANVPRENIYIHTNKDVYEAGEDLWFGALTLSSQSMRLGGLSNIAYVELRSEATNQTVAQEMFAVEAGMVKGHLYLPDTLSSGVYWLKAFTANSLKKHETPVQAVKKVLVKAHIIPHVLLQAEFDKEVFEDNEPVTGQVRLLTPDGEPVVNAKTQVSLKRGRKTEDRNRLRSDSTGRMRFSLTHRSQVANLSLLVLMDHENHEETLEIPLPFDHEKKVQLQFMPEGGNLLAGLGNTVAFKAVDESGMPFEVKKAAVYAGEDLITTFNSEHDGMGRFALLARSGVTYTVKVQEPAIDSTYTLPPVAPTGFQLTLHRKSDKDLTFGIGQTGNLASDSVHLMVKQRGVPFYVASTVIKDNGMLLTVPIDKLPQGIVEATLYDQNRLPVAERLVFIKLNQQLAITATVDKDIHAVKEKATVRLKVKDQEGNPVQSILNISAVDEVFNSPFAETNIMTHFLLSSDLKGSIHDPAYYFDKENTLADAHLDLLMLTQGWRHYKWQAKQLSTLLALDTLPLKDYLIGQIQKKTLSRAGKLKEDLQVMIFSKTGAFPLLVDDSLSFPISPEFLLNAQGFEYVLKVPEEKLARINLLDGFHYATNNRSMATEDYPFKNTMWKDRNWHKLYSMPPAAREVMGVEVVDNKNTYGLNTGTFSALYQGVSSDYVCSYDILNCNNHRFGRPPIDGSLYYLGSYQGGQIIYKAPDELRKANTFKAFYKLPEFYQPDYDAKPEEKLIPDFRNTLIWETNLVTDENGEAEVSCFTSDIRSIFNGRVEAYGNNTFFGLGQFTIKVLK